MRIKLREVLDMISNNTTVQCSSSALSVEKVKV